VLGGTNPVAGPVLQLHDPEPTGVVGILAPDEPALEGLVSRVAPAIVGGNATVIVASEPHPLSAVELGEVLATRPTCPARRQHPQPPPRGAPPWLAGHIGRERDRPHRRRTASLPELEKLAAKTSSASSRAEPTAQSPWEIAAFLELKTVWHPIGT
jgi:hypothetical protein